MPRKPPPSEPSPLETIKQAANRKSVSADTIRRRIASGELKAVRLGRRLIRVDRADVDALFQPISTVRRGDVA